MRNLFNYFILFCIIAFGGCSNSPTQVELIEEMSSAVTEMRDVTDSMTISGIHTFEFVIDLSGQTIDSIKYYLDENEIYSKITNPFSYRVLFTYDFNSELYADGWHEFGLQYYSHTRPDSTSRFYQYFTDNMSTTINIMNAPPKPIP